MAKELSVELDGQGLRVAIVTARFNEFVTRRLLEGAKETLGRHGVRDDDIVLSWVPGSFELPVVAKTLGLTGQYDAIICLGAVIRGETDHYEMVANQAAAGISAAGRGDRCTDHLRGSDHGQHGTGHQPGRRQIGKPGQQRSVGSH